MADNNGKNTRARKTTVAGNIAVGEDEKKSSAGVNKKTMKKLKRYPAIILALAFLVIGAVGGYIAAARTTYFDLLSFSVDGITSAEADYVTIDLSEKKAELEEKGEDVSTAEAVAAKLAIEDGGFEIKFLGSSVADTVTKKIYYREDISKDPQEKDKLDLSVAGTYYIEYTSSHFAFKNVKLIRTIFITGVEQDA